MKSGGCIVEQATHFVDAMRYLSKSEFKRDSIQAVGVGPDMELSDMPAPPGAEHTVRYTGPALRTRMHTGPYVLAAYLRALPSLVCLTG